MVYDFDIGSSTVNMVPFPHSSSTNAGINLAVGLFRAHIRSILDLLLVQVLLLVLVP